MRACPVAAGLQASEECAYGICEPGSHGFNVIRSVEKRGEACRELDGAFLVRQREELQTLGQRSGLEHGRQTLDRCVLLARSRRDPHSEADLPRLLRLTDRAEEHPPRP